MRIIGLVLKGYVPFRDSGIQELSVDFTEDVQITIGSNGSGKSKMQQQLTTYPTVRSMFDKTGFRSLTLEHNNIHYRLESEYEKPSSPHAFYEGDSEENLNIGRTTQGQIDLIVDHLGITPLIDDLIMNRLSFPAMGNAKRKDVLMSANPDQIGFVLPLIKQTAQKIKACKNNIARLQSRKIMLEQELIDQETVQSLENEKQSIHEDLNHFQQNIMDLEVGLRTVSSSPSVPTIDHLSLIKQTIKRSHYKLSSLSHIERDDYQRQKNKETLLSKIAVCQQRLEEADAQILQQSADLAELEVKYRDLTIDDDLHQTDLTIQRLEADRDKLQITRPAFELSPEDLVIKYQELDQLRDRLHIFSEIQVRLLPAKRRQHREKMLSLYQYRQSNYYMRLNDLEGQYEEWSKRHTLTPKDIPDSPCAKNACPLYSHFMEEYQSANDKRTSLRESIEKGRRKTERLDRYVTGLITYFQNAKPYTEQIQWLGEYARSNPILHHILRQIDILTVLSTSPNRIIHQLHDAYNRIDQWIRLKQIQADLETAYALKSRQISSESHDTIKLVSAIETGKQSLYGLRDVIKRLSERRKLLERDLRDIETFNNLKTTLMSLQQDHLILLKELSEHHEKDKLTLLRRGVEELRAKHFLRLSDIERVLRSQSSLQERYQEEVLSQITIIEKELSDLQCIETALIIIPKENMTSFINELFDQANRFIDRIWTIPLKIEPLKLEDPLTYDFYISGDNQTIREMSECSEGQTEIISLALNLALRVILGHLNLPCCLDEPGRTLDTTHQHNLITLLRRLLDDKVVSQLFLVSHHAVVHEGFSDTETLVLRDDNIMLPEKWNLHASLK